MVCLGRRTITGILCAQGRQFEDWAAAYRLFSRERIDFKAIFEVAENEILARLPPEQPLVVAMDDTLLRKRGKKIPGVGWTHDPLGPKFQRNLVWGQRMLQFSTAVPASRGACPARMIPTAIRMIPKVKKPKRNASDEAVKQYKLAREAAKSTRQAVEELALLRDRLDHGGGDKRSCQVVADGGFTNSTVLRNLPPRTVYIGRIRSDAKLYFRPRADEGRRGPGRKRSYGDRAPTPAQLLRDQSILWETAAVHVAGKTREHRYKTLCPVLWRASGADRPLRVIAVEPVEYQLRIGQRERRQPAYLICTDPDLPVERILQVYYWRWDIEVNFRDEKQLIGVGQAQVRSKASVTNAPAFAVACYALLLTASIKAYGSFGKPDSLPRPAWRKSRTGQRATTHELIKQLRYELWAKGIQDDNFSGFVSPSRCEPKPEKFRPQLMHAVMNA